MKENAMKITLCCLLLVLGLIQGEIAFAEYDKNNCTLAQFGEERRLGSKIIVFSFDARKGFNLTVDRGQWTGERPRPFLLSLMINNKPNPAFDRLYALIMKATDLRQPMYICAAQDWDRNDRGNNPIPSQEILEVGIMLDKLKEPTFPEVQKVNICDPRRTNDCADIYVGELFTRDKELREKIFR